MIIAAICPTWNRPCQLGNLIACFEAQTHDDRRLLVLDDAGQIPRMSGDRWAIHSTPHRFPTLGYKRSTAADLAFNRWPEIDALAVWDDDDVYLPWQLSALAEALQRKPWAQPRHILTPGRDCYKRYETFRREAPDDIGYHGGWGFRRQAFEQLGGYASVSNGEDFDIAARALELLGPSADTISAEHPDPGYVYNWQGGAGKHLSAMGPPGDESGYRKIGQQKIEPVDRLEIRLPEDYYLLPIEAEARARGW